MNESDQFEIRSQLGDLITSIDEWLTFAPPKRGLLQWKDFRSAKELARSFFRSGRPSPPTELLELFRHHFGQELQIVKAVPECVTRLDDFPGEHRNCDLILYGRSARGGFVANIEAKADEPFGELTGEYYDKKIGTSSNVPRRINNLATTLFGGFDERIRGLRYQLLHATVATLISARACGAETAVFIVHEFTSASLDPDKVAKNRQDWANFVRSFSEAATPNAVEENNITGPIRIPNLTAPTLYLGHVVTEVPALHAGKS